MRVRLVDDVEGEVGHRRDVAAVREHAGPGGHDLVGRDVVAERQQHRTGNTIRQRLELRQRDDVRPLLELHIAPVDRGHEHLGVHVAAGGRFVARVGNAEVAGVGDHAGEGGGGRGLGAAEVDLVLFRPRAPGEVARERAQARLARRGSLPHPDAPVAAGLVEPGATGDQVEEPTLTRQRLERLSRRRVDIEGDALVRLPAAHHQRRDREVAQARVGRRPDDDLVHVAPCDLAHGNHVAGAGRAGDERLEGREIDLVGVLVGGVGIGAQLAPLVLAALGGEEAAHLVVGREDARGGAELGAHVRDHVPVHRRQLLERRTVVLDDPAEPSVDVVAPQHLEDHVLGAHPFGELADQPDAPDLRHREMERLACDRERDLETAGADCQHPERPGGAGVAVGADHRLARGAEALHVHRVADTVARLAEPEAEPAARALEEHVVVGVAEVGLEDVVVDVLGRHLGVRPVEAHRLELEHDHRARGVLGECLVDPDADLGAGGHLAVDDVLGDELLRNVSSHGPQPGRPAAGGEPTYSFLRIVRRVQTGQL